MNDTTPNTCTTAHTIGAGDRHPAETDRALAAMSADLLPRDPYAQDEAEIQAAMLRIQKAAALGGYTPLFYHEFPNDPTWMRRGRATFLEAFNVWAHMAGLPQPAVSELLATFFARCRDGRFASPALAVIYGTTPRKDFTPYAQIGVNSMDQRDHRELGHALMQAAMNMRYSAVRDELKRMPKAAEIAHGIADKYEDAAIVALRAAADL